MRVFATFNKGEEQKFISHLDVLRAVQRALRRAKIPVKYSGGFNPHPVLSFASALSLGVTSSAEVFDVAVEDGAESSLFEALAPHMPEGMELVSAHAVADDYPAAMSLVAAADYEIALQAGGECDTMAVDAALGALLDQPLMAMKKTKAGLKEIDLRPLIYGIEHHWSGGDLIVNLRCGVSPQGALNPRLLLPFLTKGMEDAQDKTRRTALWAARGGEYVPLWDAAT